MLKRFSALDQLLVILLSLPSLFPFVGAQIPPGCNITSYPRINETILYDPSDTSIFTPYVATSGACPYSFLITFLLLPPAPLKECNAIIDDSGTLSPMVCNQPIEIGIDDSPLTISDLFGLGVLPVTLCTKNVTIGPGYMEEPTPIYTFNWTFPATQATVTSTVLLPPTTVQVDQATKTASLSMSDEDGGFNNEPRWNQKYPITSPIPYGARAYPTARMGQYADNEGVLARDDLEKREVKIRDDTTSTTTTTASVTFQGTPPGPYPADGDYPATWTTTIYVIESVTEVSGTHSALESIA